MDGGAIPVRWDFCIRFEPYQTAHAYEPHMLSELNYELKKGYKPKKKNKKKRSKECQIPVTYFKISTTRLKLAFILPLVIWIGKFLLYISYIYLWTSQCFLELFFLKLFEQTSQFWMHILFSFPWIGKCSKFYLQTDIIISLFRRSLLIYAPSASLYLKFLRALRAFTLYVPWSLRTIITRLARFFCAPYSRQY